MIDLTLGRAALEQAMVDRCRVERNPGGVADDVLDRDTGQLIPVDPELVFTGRCTFLDPSKDNSGDPTPAESNAVRTEYLLRLPVSELTVEPRPGDLVTCLAAAHDPGLPGTRFVVEQPHRSTYALSRELQLRVVSWTST